MGVTNGNAAFQRMLENLLEPVRNCADPFVDDVIIASGDPSMSYEELLEAQERDVTRVLDLLVRLKPVRTPVAILGSLGVCIYVPVSRHWLISYSPIHLN